MHCQEAWWRSALQGAVEQVQSLWVERANVPGTPAPFVLKMTLLCRKHDKLVVSTHLKNSSQIRLSPQLGVKRKHNIWNHHANEVCNMLMIEKRDMSFSKHPRFACRSSKHTHTHSIRRYQQHLLVHILSPTIKSHHKPEKNIHELDISGSTWINRFSQKTTKRFQPTGKL